MEILGRILFLVLLVTPLFFQILFGSGLIPVSRKMKFWFVCVISVVSLFVIYFIHAKMFLCTLTEDQIRYGMPVFGIMRLEEIMAAAIVLTILIQILVKYFRNCKKS